MNAARCFCAGRRFIIAVKSLMSNGHGSYSGTMPKEKSGLAVYIGTNVKYAEKQENGD